ncbi:ATP-binding protein [Hyalangium gracile]|uniref:ATP-binding protein n=1 Tax=Hyalangium gracile TaxID=394092 RepID=UPI001CCAAB84|nr:ATP-binding protein [Hyalangium gracile]
MNESSLAQPFACRTALPPGAPSFAGHRRLKKLLATLGGVQTNSVSVVGPRQSGRSSLLQQLSYPPNLQLALKDAVIVQASFRDHRGEPQGAIRYLINQVAEALDARGLPPQSVRGAESMVDAVKQALLVFPGRLIIVIDDFEAVGSDLQRDHQSDLRQAVYNQTRAGYVVASRLPLTQCLQEWNDDMSDFAPILTTIPGLLAPLNRREIQELVQKALGLPPESAQPELIARFVHERVGGFCLWVHQVLGILFLEELLGSRELEQSELKREEIDALILQGLQQDWSSAYRRLSPEARDVLGQPGEASDWTLEELQVAGWSAPDLRNGFKPAGLLLDRWLRERRWERDPPLTARRESEDLYEQLVSAVGELNTRNQRLRHRPKELVIRPDVFYTAQDLPFLRRKVTSPENFGRFVLSLARLLYDGTGGATEKKKLPPACYENPDCIVRQVMTLRNTWVHLGHPDEQVHERNQESATAIYQRYIGTLDPRTPDEFGRLADALLQETIRFIGALTQVCPFAEGLKIEPLLLKGTALP